MRCRRRRWACASGAATSAPRRSCIEATSATGARGDRTESEATISEVVAWRRANQPGGQNAGSVFVNPVPGEVSAGALIDQLGLRGLRVGSAQVSDKHANFIQADDGGSADDVHALMETGAANGCRGHRATSCAARSVCSGIDDRIGRLMLGSKWRKRASRSTTSSDVRCPSRSPVPGTDAADEASDDGRARRDAAIHRRRLRRSHATPARRRPTGDQSAPSTTAPARAGERRGARRAVRRVRRAVDDHLGRRRRTARRRVPRRRARTGRRHRRHAVHRRRRFRADAVAPKEASTRGIEPRLRQRRIGVRRAESRRRLRWLVIGGVVLVVVVAALAVARLVAVRGRRGRRSPATCTPTPTELQAVVDDLMGTPVLLVDTLAAEERARVDPVGRGRPGDARRSRTRRRSRSANGRPLVAMPGADGLSRVLDRDGRVLATRSKGSRWRSVWISGPGTLDTRGRRHRFDRLFVGGIARHQTDADDPLAGRLDDGHARRLRPRLILTGVEPTGRSRSASGRRSATDDQIAKLVRLERKLEDIGADPVSVIDVSTSEVTVL